MPLTVTETAAEPFETEAETSLSIFWRVAASIFTSIPLSLATVVKPFEPVIFKGCVARLTTPVPVSPAVFKLMALMAVSTAPLVTALLSPAVTAVDLFNVNVTLFASAVLVISVPSPTMPKVSPNFLTALPLLPVKVIGILRTLLIALVTSPAVAILLGFVAVALPVVALVVILVVFTSNFTIVPFSVSVTFAVVKFPFLKFTTPLLLMRDLGEPFSCTLKPLLFNTA